MPTQFTRRWLLPSALFLVTLMQAPTHSPKSILPQPHWNPQASDPPWLASAVQFHGHLGPWAVSGIRLGAAGREALAARGYFDLSVTCTGPFVTPPKSCFLDGLQVATGATLGKRNLKWAAADEVAVEMTNTRTGRTVTVRPTKALLDLLTRVPRPAARADDNDHDDGDGHDHDDDHDHGLDQARLETLARQIATMPTEQIAEIKQMKQSEKP